MSARVLMPMLLVWTTLAGCGDETAGGPADAGPAADAIPRAQRYLPLAVGTTWTWRVTPRSGAPYEKVSTVEALEDVGGAKAGVKAFRVRTSGGDGVTVSWQEDTGASIRRHREQSLSPALALRSEQVYMPSKLRLDEASARLVVGASYKDIYVEVETDASTGKTKTVTKAETWTVEAIDEAVTVPAGTFACVRLRRVGADPTDADKRFWFAKGVGKVKESGNQTEELKSYAP